MKKYLLLLLAMTASLTTAGYGQDFDFPNDMDPGILDQSKNGVKMVAMATDSEKPFRAGDMVKLRVDVNYVLVDPSGFLGLVIYKDNGSGDPLANMKQEIKKGKGMATLKTSFTIPKKAKAIRIYCPLFIEGSDSTSTVDGRLIDFREQEKYMQQMKKQKGLH